MKLPLVFYIATTLHCIYLAHYVQGRVECYTQIAPDGRLCLTEGKFRTETIEECCLFANTTGFTDTTGWLHFPDYFNLKKTVSCISCTTTFATDSKWCFAYRNSADQACIHIPHYSTLAAQSEQDCCLWTNASGYTEDPSWRWSNSYGHFYTTCNSCYRDGLVTCYAKFHVADVRATCDEPLPRLATTPNECCNQPKVEGFSWVDRTSRSRTCYSCSVDGGWSSWSTWSQCSATCGGGSQQRLRFCNNPPPRYRGRACPGLQEEREDCNTIPCPEVEMTTAKPDIVWPDSAGIWSRWSPFSECSTTCGVGVAERHRTCLTHNNPRLRCTGENQEVHPCKRSDCPTPTRTPNVSTAALDRAVNWTWSAWSPCHASCGYGIRTRITTCLSLSSDAENRTDCLVENTEVEVCHQPACNLVQSGEQDTSPGLIAAWSVTAVACVALLVGIAIFGCQRRCCTGYRPQFLGRQQQRSMRKGRSELGQLPPLPATVPTSQYHSMADQTLRYVPDPYTRPDSCLDDDGYEIPLPYEEDPRVKGQKEDIKRSPQPPPGWDPLPALNHVYEQVDFDIDHVTHTGSKVAGQRV